ncbi:MAG TPA: CHAT domain-containing protein [Blastocatellia bacterium]|jgi:hypothetical protein|nr:CHAT domain-containing protein [Blastocatellia bacterium]
MIRVSAEPTTLFAGQPNDVAISLTNAEKGACTNLVFKIAMPAGMVLLRGLDRIEVPRLAAGQSVSHAISILPKRTGNWAITSSNFSYSDSFGRSTRVSDTRLDLSVVEAPPPLPEANVSVSLRTTELAWEEWGMIEGEIFNNGPVDLESIEVRVAGPLRCEAPSKSAGPIGEGEAFEFSLAARMSEKGASVPIKLETSYVDSEGRAREKILKTSVRVVDPADRRSASVGRDMSRSIIVTGDGNTIQTGPHGSAQADGKRRDSEAVTRILFLSADPSDTSRLRLGEEVREIRKELQLGEMRSRFEFEDRMAIRPEDVSRELLAVKPRIVHFSGHGNKKGAIYLQDNAGESHAVDAETLGDLFELASDQVECVLLNACYSAKQGAAIARSIKYVIGMNKAVTDDAAIAFSVGFYQAVGAGIPIEGAFKYGKVQIRLKGIPEHLNPVLIERP